MAKDFAAFIEELKDKCDITDIISGYVSLERKSGRFWGRCPFHTEKTPSFTVNEEGQFYHCFGCGASGDVIKFIQEMESLDFMDAVRFLCEKCGMDMPNTFSGNKDQTAQLKAQKDRLLSAMKDAAMFYYICLTKHSASLEYLRQRGITKESIKKFGLGYCPAGGAVNYLRQKGYSDSELITCGIMSQGKTDTLEYRLIIPIINSMGDVIAFGGRDLSGKSPAKYKNTAETPLFNKSKNLFGINLLKKSRHKGIIIIVEGYMDVISLTQAGIKGAVASMGTSLTREQAKLIKRFSSGKAVICYDGDSAGQAATLRGLDILKEAGLSVNVATLSEGNDPDDYIKSKGKEAFEKLIEDAPPLADFKIMTLEKKYNINSADGKRTFAAEAIKVIAKEQSQVVREELLRQLSEKTQLTYQSLQRELDSAAKGNELKASPVLENTKDENSSIIKAVRFALYCMLNNKEYATDYKLLEKFISINEAHKNIYNYIIECKKNNNEIKLSAVLNLSNYGGEAQKEYINVLECGEGMQEEQIKKFYYDCVKFFNKMSIQDELSNIIREYEGETDMERRKQLLFKIQALQQQAKENN